MPDSLSNESVFLLAVGAQVTLKMDDVVEVYKGDPAIIHCHYSFAQNPSMVRVQWFVVCTHPLIWCSHQHSCFVYQLIGCFLTETKVAPVLNDISLESQRGPGGKRVRISYSDLTMQKVDENTTYTDRISILGNTSSETLTIVDVRLSDEREFFCQVNGLAAGIGEGRTHLKVFSKSASSFPPTTSFVNLSGGFISLPLFI